MVFFSGHPDKQPEFAECCFDSCPALLIQRSGTIQEVSAAAAELHRLHLQQLKRRFFKKKLAACGFHLSFSRFSCDVHAPFGLRYFSQALCFNAQLCLHFIPFGFGFQSFAR